MGKASQGFLTPKAIANRIKAKGLQKLKWYCQMCEKQCRDENGFKCHMMSESHQRQLLLFAENPDDYIDSFSKDFLEGFMELLQRRFGTKRVHANIVYQEYITDRHHIHMNSTQWETLTDFVKWTGREGYCEVDYTEKGWFCRYIDRTPESIQRQLASKAKEKMELDDVERSAKFIEKQIERAAGSERVKAGPEFTELKRENEEEKVAFNLACMKKKEDENKKMEIKNVLKDVGKDVSESKTKLSKTFKEPLPPTGIKRKSCALDEIMKFEEMKRERMNRKDNWLHENIVVKIITKKLGEKYYKKKAVVKEVQNLFTAVVKLLDSGEKVKLDQTHLETVIPALVEDGEKNIEDYWMQHTPGEGWRVYWLKHSDQNNKGKTVLIVNGAYRGSVATLQSLNEEKFCCTVRIRQGPLAGRTIERTQYEDISKRYQPS